MTPRSEVDRAAEAAAEGRGGSLREEVPADEAQWVVWGDAEAEAEWAAALLPVSASPPGR